MIFVLPIWNFTEWNKYFKTIVQLYFECALVHLLFFSSFFPPFFSSSGESKKAAKNKEEKFTKSSKKQVENEADEVYHISSGDEDCSKGMKSMNC